MKKINKKIKWYYSVSWIISIMAFAIIWIGIPSITMEVANPVSVDHFVQVDNMVVDNQELDQDICGMNNVECDGYITMKTTSFSSVECNTNWCNANAGLPRGNKVALNSKYGKYSQVYVPKYNRTYEVIGTTDYKTDLDFWNGDNHRAALEHGTQYLKIQLIK